MGKATGRHAGGVGWVALPARTAEAVMHKRRTRPGLVPTAWSVRIGSRTML